MLIRIWLISLLVVLSADSAWAQMAKGPPDQAGSGYFRDQDTLPGTYRLYRQLPGGPDSWWSLGPGQQRPRKSSFKLDAHDTTVNYSPSQLCTDCHKEKAKDLHRVRMGIVCTQCHRSQPVAGVYHYYSSLNPIRRHAYVCTKCHEGATPSFASYVVHEPNPISQEARESFPMLYYAVWFMAILAAGVFVVFIPYVGLWTLRELIGKLTGRTGHG